jgi:CarD family transcriptional regulator
MKFQVGDTIMHWSHGLGHITGLEEREVMGESQLYYVVQMQDFNVWVPADKMLAGRLRPPTPAPAFKKLLAILSGPAEVLPDDRHERKSLLRARMSGGTAESICHVIRDLAGRQEVKTLNDDDMSTMKRASGMLLGEWVYSLKIPPTQAEDDLHRLLKTSPVRAGA